MVSLMPCKLATADLLCQWTTPSDAELLYLHRATYICTTQRAHHNLSEYRLKKKKTTQRRWLGPARQIYFIYRCVLWEENCRSFGSNNLNLVRDYRYPSPWRYARLPRLYMHGYHFLYSISGDLLNHRHPSAGPTETCWQLQALRRCM